MILQEPCTYIHTYLPTYLPAYVRTYMHNYLQKIYIHTYIYIQIDIAIARYTLHRRSQVFPPLPVKAFALRCWDNRGVEEVSSNVFRTSADDGSGAFRIYRGRLQDLRR